MEKIVCTRMACVTTAIIFLVAVFPLVLSIVYTVQYSPIYLLLNLLYLIVVPLVPLVFSAIGKEGGK